MKKAVMLIACLPMFAQAKSIFADVQINQLAQSQQSQWQLSEQPAPQYPKALAQKMSRGCGVFQLRLAADASITEVTMAESVVLGTSKRVFLTETKKLLSQLQWQAAHQVALPSQATVRVDYCLSSESSQHSEAMCQRQAQTACQM
ncbi:hypothetical protein [uncultured Ferrimonas sp.]|uniref:hypothetical protein n=1 Tax=uncultured Ferrimonas sp. TaxID=432640 RepID=UPI0026122E21|nr:hypothetical protein [uncultured Ferrimonas sp.]